MGTFNLGEVGEYVPKLVEENDFLNQKLENDTYGIYYSVMFEGDADTYLLQAKKAPVVGEPEWGSIELSKSGKSKRFKRAKREGTAASPSDNKFLKDITDLPDRWLARLVGFYDVQSLVKDGKPTEQFRNLVETAQVFTDESMRMIESIRSGSPSEPTPESETKVASPAADSKFKFNREPVHSDEDAPFDE